MTKPTDKGPIGTKRAELAVEFIGNHAKRCGQLTGLCKKLEHERKVVHAEAALASTLSTVAERDAAAYASQQFGELLEEIENAWADKVTLELQIEAAKYTVSVWQSKNKWGDTGL